MPTSRVISLGAISKNAGITSLFPAKDKSLEEDHKPWECMLLIPMQANLQMISSSDSMMLVSRPTIPFDNSAGIWSPD